MKKSILILIITTTLFALYANAQTDLYYRYLKQGIDFYNKSEYLTALERFDLAYEFAKSNTQKDEAKMWKKKSGKIIRKQQADLKEALAEAERALSMTPDNAETQLTMGETLILVGRSSEAVSFIKKAMELNPNYSPFYLHLLGLAHFCLEQYDQALVSLKTHNQRDPKENKWLLAATYAHIGRDQEASEVLQNYMKKLKFTGFTVQSVLKCANYAFKDPKDTERFAEGLLKAGLK